MAVQPEDLIENPGTWKTANIARHDVLSDVLRAVRLSGSMQFCFMPEGDWETDDKPSFMSRGDRGLSTIPFHIVVEGECWIEIEGRRVNLVPGDVVAFPFASGHKLGVGRGGQLVNPSSLLPPKPWSEVPVIHYGDSGLKLRLLCGYLRCDAMNFRPLQHAMPALLHMRSRSVGSAAWVSAAITQLVNEVDRPRSGGQFLLERVTEVIFVELLRHQMIATQTAPAGWLAALADPALGQCLTMIHANPGCDWSVQGLATASGLSRSVLSERFEAMLGISPMRYVRDWRLFLASTALGTTSRSISAIAHEAGYGTEAAFSRAFSRSYGAPPATWRQQAKDGQL